MVFLSPFSGAPPTVVKSILVSQLPSFFLDTPASMVASPARSFSLIVAHSRWPQILKSNDVILCLNLYHSTGNSYLLLLKLWVLVCLIVSHLVCMVFHTGANICTFVSTESILLQLFRAVLITIIFVMALLYYLWLLYYGTTMYYGTVLGYYVMVLLYYLVIKTNITIFWIKC